MANLDIFQPRRSGKLPKDLSVCNRWVQILINNDYTLTDLSEETGISISWLSRVSTACNVMLPMARRVVDGVNELCSYVANTNRMIRNPNYSKITVHGGWTTTREVSAEGKVKKKGVVYDLGEDLT